nr:transcription termination/antitermination NusG family protein [Candidatus Protochlamydia amoebophila]
MYKWYVVQVLSTHEKKVKKALEEHLELKGMSGEIEQILLPTENVSEVKKVSNMLLKNVCGLVICSSK